MSRALVQWRVVRELMADVLTPEQRRKNMQHIKSNNTKIEVLLRKALWRNGKDWEVLRPRLEKSNNSDFWISKISRNRERDDEINKKLLFMGWTVIRFWGNDIKKNTDECVRVVEEIVFDLKMEASEE